MMSLTFRLAYVHKLQKILRLYNIFKLISSLVIRSMFLFFTSKSSGLFWTRNVQIFGGETNCFNNWNLSFFFSHKVWSLGSLKLIRWNKRNIFFFLKQIIFLCIPDPSTWSTTKEKIKRINHTHTHTRYTYKYLLFFMNKILKEQNEKKNNNETLSI